MQHFNSIKKQKLILSLINQQMKFLALFYLLQMKKRINIKIKVEKENLKIKYQINKQKESKNDNMQKVENKNEEVSKEKAGENINCLNEKEKDKINNIRNIDIYNKEKWDRMKSKILVWKN